MFRIGIFRILQQPTAVKALTAVERQQTVRTLTKMSVQKLLDEIEPRPRKPAPFDYKNKAYQWYHFMYEGTSKRFDDRTRLIVVEGSLASGKTELAKHLAEELEFEYFPEANQDMYYINHYGYDLRKLDPELPVSCKSFDINNFLLNPKDKRVADFQINQLRVKFHQYMDILLHMLSTGQGVVMDRCALSDFVFLEAMHSQKYLSKAACNYYYEIRRNSIFPLLKPHLTIYLDVSVPKIMENIKKRNLPYEVNSKVLSPQYLETIEYQYKEKYLPEASKYSEVLIYDWSQEKNTEQIFDDIEKINFERPDIYQSKFRDWDKEESELCLLRNHLSAYKYGMINNTYLPAYHVPELAYSTDDVHTYWNIRKSAPGERHPLGYNTDMGDPKIYLLPKYDPMLLPKNERRTQFPPAH